MDIDNEYIRKMRAWCESVNYRENTPKDTPSNEEEDNPLQAIFTALEKNVITEKDAFKKIMKAIRSGKIDEDDASEIIEDAFYADEIPEDLFDRLNDKLDILDSDDCCCKNCDEFIGDDDECGYCHMPKKCEGCGEELTSAEDEKYCPNCGKKKINWF